MTDIDSPDQTLTRAAIRVSVERLEVCQLPLLSLIRNSGAARTDPELAEAVGGGARF